MNISFYTFDFTSQVTQVSVSSIPGRLWELYLEYLWFYQSDSWVATIAYACRVLAVLISLPLVILGLLDIASYGIARTLGVVDDVKASTSDKSTIHIQSPPSITTHGGTSSPGSESVFSDSDRESLADHAQHNKFKSPLSDSVSDVSSPSVPPAIFYTEDSGKLSGVGVFSPAASLPPSPTSSRRNLSEIVPDNFRHRPKHSKNTSDNNGTRVD